MFKRKYRQIFLASLKRRKRFEKRRFVKILKRKTLKKLKR
jgi:hypothetical protein